MNKLSITICLLLSLTVSSTVCTVHNTVFAQESGKIAELLKGAEAGDAVMQVALGPVYYNGDGVAKDHGHRAAT